MPLRRDSLPRLFRYGLLALVVIVLAGLILPYIVKSRNNNDRVRCQNHLRELGLFGVRHAAAPGQQLPLTPRDELPPGTFKNPALTPEQRMSWYAYVLNALADDAAMADPQAPKRGRAGLAEAMRGFVHTEPWNAGGNGTLAHYRLTTALCPAQVRDRTAGAPALANYLACGGIGPNTPGLTLEESGRLGGAYRYNGATPLSAFPDGLRQTVQIIETNRALGPWLQGGPSTLRALDPTDAPFLGVGWQFGGCHVGGCNAAMADGSVRFIRETIDPGILQALFTRAGGPEEINADLP